MEGAESASHGTSGVTVSADPSLVLDLLNGPHDVTAMLTQANGNIPGCCKWL